MFKKTLFALGLSVIAATAMAATEGTDYVKLDKPMVNAEGKLTKIFSYDCPFCFKYDVGVAAHRKGSRFGFQSGTSGNQGQVRSCGK